MKKAVKTLIGLMIFSSAIFLYGGGDAKKSGTEYSIRVDQYSKLTRLESDKATEQLLKTHADVAGDLIGQLQQNPSAETKVYLIYLLGQIRDVRAVGVLTDNIDHKAPKLDLASRIARWGDYPAAEALANIGIMSIQEIAVRLPKEQPELRRKLMVTVIRDTFGERLGRLYLDELAAEQKTDEAKKHLKMSLDAFDSLRQIQKK